MNRPNEGGAAFSLTTRPNLPALTSLRLFAALAVVTFHYPDKLTLFPAGLADFGYDAVTFFFVLSGFILTYVHGTQRGINVSVRAFVAARIARIAPAYYVALAVSAPVFLLALSRDFGLAPGILLVPLMLQSWVPQFAMAWNSPAWSLSNELFFYLLFPTIYGAAGQLRNRFLTAATALVLIAWIGREALFIGNEDVAHHFRAYFPLFNLPQFVLGVALGRLFIERGPCRPRVHTWLFIAGCLSVGALVSIKGEVPWLSNTASLSAAFALIIYGGANLERFLERPLATGPLLQLGEASYALYILHAPIWFWWNHITRVALDLQLPKALDFGLYLGIAVAASLATMAFVEKSLRTFIRSALTPAA